MIERRCTQLRFKICRKIRKMARHRKLTRNKHFKKKVIIILPYICIIRQEKSKFYMILSISLLLESHFRVEHA